MNWAELFCYDAETGVLSWRVRRPGRARGIGEEVGSVRADGRYRTVHINHRRYYVHRIVWEMHNCPIPAGLCIDHLNGNGLDNRLANLRLATPTINQRNRKRLNRNNTTGVAGVVRIPDGFMAQIANKYIGTFSSIEAAAAARQSAEQRLGFTYRET